MIAQPRRPRTILLVDGLVGRAMLAEHGLCVLAEPDIGLHCDGRQEEEHADCDLD
jgi:hypothetical protein